MIKIDSLKVAMQFYKETNKIVPLKIDKSLNFMTAQPFHYYTTDAPHGKRCPICKLEKNAY